MVSVALIHTSPDGFATGDSREMVAVLEKEAEVTLTQVQYQVGDAPLMMRHVLWGAE